MDITKAAHEVALEHLGDRAAEYSVAVAKNAILDVLGQSEESDFIAKACGSYGNMPEARHVVRRIAPHLVSLCGETIARWRV